MTDTPHLIKPPSRGAQPRDLVIVGGGVMGLFTAYYASGVGASVTVLERSYVGDPQTASYGRTRSWRRDYLDTTYARLAEEAITLWERFEADMGVRALVRCGLLNLTSSAITPDVASTYGARTYELMRRLGMNVEELDAATVAKRYPDIITTVGHYDTQGGVADLGAVTLALQSALARRGVEVIENCTVTSIDDSGDCVTVDSSNGVHTARNMVVTAGHGTNDVLAMLPGGAPHVPLTKDRPQEARYYTPAAADRPRFTSDRLPVIAYLDCGIYLHPIVEGVSDAVKIGFYNPPDLPILDNPISGIDDFVQQVMPGLTGTPWTPVSDVDCCDYDLVADDDFVLGPVPGHPAVKVGVGWRGTGYKFAPLIGRILFELALRGGTVYDIDRFTPARFARGAA